MKLYWKVIDEELDFLKLPLRRDLFKGPRVRRTPRVTGMETWLKVDSSVQKAGRKATLNRTRSRSDKRRSWVNRSPFLRLIPHGSPSSALACIIYIVPSQVWSFDRGFFSVSSGSKRNPFDEVPSATSRGEIFSFTDT